MATQTSAGARQWKTGSSVWLFILVILAPATAFAAASYGGNARVAWLLSMFFFSAVLYFVGTKMNGQPLGVLIDDRNVMSLARFQMVAWTLLIIPALLAAAMWNMSIETNLEPLTFEMPTELWTLMGISTASLVASPLILNNKKKVRVSKSEAQQTAKDLEAVGDDEGGMKVNGSLIENESAEAARFSDILTGEEAGNASKADIARIQMFFITLTVLATYAVALWRMFGALDGQSVEAFPGLDESILALIGISHAGYLTSKAVSHSSPPDEDDGTNTGQSQLAPSAPKPKSPLKFKL